jgi:hypothetical protein
MPSLVEIELVMLEDVAGRREQETARAGRRIDDCGSRLGAYHFDDRIDQNARREVLTRAGLRILRVLFE